MFGSNRQFQAGLDQKEARRQREKISLSLRRKDREIKLQNKRKKILNTTKKGKNIPNPNAKVNNPIPSDNINKLLFDLPKYVRGCFTEHPAAIYECSQKIRQLLSFSNVNVPIKQVIDSGVIPRIIQLLHFKACPEIQFESMWILTNIASSDKPEYTATVIRNGAIPLIQNILKISKYPLQEQAIWALGNIAGECLELRDMIISNGILADLLNICRLPMSNHYYWNNQNNQNQNTQMQYESLLNTLSWTLSNLCRGGKHKEKEYLLLLIECTYYLIKYLPQISNENRIEIEINIAWNIFYLTMNHGFDDDNDELFHHMNRKGIIRQLIAFLDRPTNVYRPSIKAIGNILTGNDIYTQQCIDYGLLISLYKLLKNELNKQNQKQNNAIVLKELCWSISNITAGPIKHIECVIKSNIFPILCLLLKSAPTIIANEALWALANATNYDEKAIIYYLCDEENECKLIECLCYFNKRCFQQHEIFNKNMNKILTISLECIENILICDTSNTPFALAFEIHGGCDFLEYIQTVDKISQAAYDKTVAILKKYFMDNDNINNNNQNNTNQMDISFNNNNTNRQFGNQFGFGFNQSNNNNNNNNNNTFQF